MGRPIQRFPHTPESEARVLRPTPPPMATPAPLYLEAWTPCTCCGGSGIDSSVGIAYPCMGCPERPGYMPKLVPLADFARAVAEAFREPRLEAVKA